MLALRHTLARRDVRVLSVALEQSDLRKLTRQHLRREQASDTAADHDRVIPV